MVREIGKYRIRYGGGTIYANNDTSGGRNYAPSSIDFITVQKNYACTIFQAVNKHAVTGIITALCHSGYEEEANKVMMNLVTLYKERFDKKRNYGLPRMAKKNQQIKCIIEPQIQLTLTKQN